MLTAVYNLNLEGEADFNLPHKAVFMTREEEIKLVEKAKFDSEAFGELYEYYFPRVYAFVAAKLNSKENAEDVVSNIFIKIVENISGYEDRGLPFGAWVFRVARNCLYDYYISHNKGKTIDIEEAHGVSLPEEEHSPAKKAEYYELSEKVKDILEKLPEREASIVQLKFFSGLNNREIASALSLTESNVGIILFRILKRIKPDLMELIN